MSQSSGLGLSSISCVTGANAGRCATTTLTVATAASVVAARTRNGERVMGSAPGADGTTHLRVADRVAKLARCVADSAAHTHTPMRAKAHKSQGLPPSAHHVIQR